MGEPGERSQHSWFLLILPLAGTRSSTSMEGYVPNPGHVDWREETFEEYIETMEKVYKLGRQLNEDNELIEWSGQKKKRS